MCGTHPSAGGCVVAVSPRPPRHRTAIVQNLTNPLGLKPERFIVAVDDEAGGQVVGYGLGIGAVDTASLRRVSPAEYRITLVQTHSKFKSNWPAPAPAHGGVPTRASTLPVSAQLELYLSPMGVSRRCQQEEVHVCGGGGLYSIACTAL